MRRFYLMLILLGAMSLLAASAPASDLSTQEIRDARKLYIGKCTKCHKLYDPTQYNDADWTGWMTKMTRKSRLTPKQAELLSQYLDQKRATAKASTSNP